MNKSTANHVRSTVNPIIIINKEVTPMSNFNAKAFIDSLTQDMQEKVKACKTAAELQALIENNHIDLTAFAEARNDAELSFDELDGVAGGKGFLQAAVASVIMLTGAGAVVANTAAPLTASASYVTDWAENKDDIDDYFYDLEHSFNENSFFDSVVNDDGTTPQKIVRNSDGSVSIVQKKKVSDKTSTTSFGVSTADMNNIYPGALLKANQGLVTGNPTPIRIARRDIGISVPNAYMQDGASSKITVNPTNASDVHSAINEELVGKFKENTDFPARVVAKIEKVESETQIKAKMNFSEEVWGNLKIEASADYKNNKQAVVVDISQIFYTVSADIQTSADLFPDNMKMTNRFTREINAETPPVVVSSVDYGKRVLAIIQTDDTSFDLKAAVEASGVGGKVKGSIEGEYKNQLKNCSVRLTVMGGSSESAGSFMTCKIEDLLNVASKNTKYDGYAVPVSYTTRWATTGNIATSHYFGEAWQTVTAKKLTNAVPARFKVYNVEGTNDNKVTGGTADIYGRRVIDVNPDGSFVKGEEELIKHIELDYEASENFILPADVVLDSVKVVYSYYSNTHVRRGPKLYARHDASDKDMVIYMSDALRGSEHSASDYDVIEFCICCGLSVGSTADIESQKYCDRIVGYIAAPVKADKQTNYEKNYKSVYGKVQFIDRLEQI